jgi:hypothetical protein
MGDQRNRFVQASHELGEAGDEGAYGKGDQQKESDPQYHSERDKALPNEISKPRSWFRPYFPDGIE